MSEIQRQFLKAVSQFSSDVQSRSVSTAQSAHQLLEATYESSEPYTPQNLDDEPVTFTVFDWAYMHRDVRPLIALEGEQVSEAFRVVLSACKQFEWAADRKLSEPALGPEVQTALETIAQIYPQGPALH